MFVLAVLLNFGIRDLDRQVSNDGSGLHSITSIVGTCVSGFFLFLIAAFNIVILAGILKVFREMRTGAYNDQELEEQLNKRGLMNRFFGHVRQVCLFSRDMKAPRFPGSSASTCTRACSAIIIKDAGIPYIAFKYAENSGQMQPIREQAGTFADSIKLWSAA